MPESKNLTEAVKRFADHYEKRLKPVETKIVENDKNIKKQFLIRSEQLRNNNFPMIFSHGEKTKDVIVLTHGLTDSPYYMQAIGERFYQAGLNVVLPLLPAHGLNDPDKALEDRELDQKWQEEIDQAVEVALLLGDRVSLGGFSTGGALSLNKILRDSNKIKGGLFLFSAAIDLGLRDEPGRFRLTSAIFEEITTFKDGELSGDGPNPYKYPEFSEFAAIELGQVIQKNEALLKEWEDRKEKISNPVFAAHSVHDETLKIAGTIGILELLTHHVRNGLAFFIANNVRHEDNLGPDNVRHGEVVLARDIELMRLPIFATYIKQPKANPKFNLMMQTAIQFFSDSLI